MNDDKRFKLSADYIINEIESLRQPHEDGEQIDSRVAEMRWAALLRRDFDTDVRGLAQAYLDSLQESERLEDYRQKMVRELDIALHGKAGVKAKTPENVWMEFLGEVVGMRMQQERLTQENVRLKENR